MSSTKTKTKKSDEMTLSRARDDFRWAYQYKRSFMKAAEDDMEFALGKQWRDEDVKELEGKGILPITINEIAPIIQLLHGIESQNRADIRAYPEGAEDSVKADIATRLLKNALMKQAEAQYKVTDAFNDGNMCGESWLEPWMDYSDNLIYANFRIKKSDFTQFFWDPNAREYDLSDGQFLCKVTFDLTKDQILMIYPEADTILEEVVNGKLDTGLVNMEQDILGIDRQKKGYDKDSDQFDWQRKDVPTLDLLEYFYKKYVDVWYVADGRLGRIREFASKQDAENFVTVANEKDPEGKKLAKAFRRRRPEIWLLAGCGGTDAELAHERAWSYPNWKGWPHIPYFARKSTIKFKNESRHLAVQGITRQLKGLNQEKNKRRTQELRHLNQSANSGWLTPENSWVNRDDVAEEGSGPGVNLEYKPEIGKPERIFPQPLSQGHAQLAQEHSADIKTASGINTDLLAAESGGADSGRAIALRQKQGLVMVQGLFDNLSRSKKIMAKFVLTQLPDIFTMERAVRVCGEAFIKDNFSVPVMAPVVDPATGQPVVDPKTGQPAMMPQQDPQTGQPVTKIDQEAVIKTFNEVLQDKELALYDVAVGEVVSQETIQYANYVMLLEMAGKGIPIPPDVLVDQSTLPQDQKAKIQSALQRQAAAVAPAPTKK